MAFECPVCQRSDSVQSFQMVYNSGVSRGWSTGFGTGFAGGELVSVYTGGPTYSISNLARSVNPPQRKRVKGILMLSLSIVPCVVSWFIESWARNYFQYWLADTMKVSFFLFLALCIIGIARIVSTSIIAVSYNNNEYPIQLNNWHHSYICFRDGTRFQLPY